MVSCLTKQARQCNICYLVCTHFHVGVYSGYVNFWEIYLDKKTVCVSSWCIWLDVINKNRYLTVKS